jgi:hypothetical protein
MVRAFWAKPVVAKRRWKLASHALAGNPTVASRPERTVETMNLSVILFSGPTSTTLPHQPPCGWISACRRWNGSKPRGPADEVAQSQRRRRDIFRSRIQNMPHYRSPALPAQNIPGNVKLRESSERGALLREWLKPQKPAERCSALRQSRGFLFTLNVRIPTLPPIATARSAAFMPPHRPHAHR